LWQRTATRRRTLRGAGGSTKLSVVLGEKGLAEKVVNLL